MIRYNIKVSNDHQSLTEHFEATDLFMSSENHDLQERIKSVMAKFNAPVDDVTIKAKMDV